MEKWRQEVMNEDYETQEMEDEYEAPSLYLAIMKVFMETRGSIYTADALFTELIEWGIIEANDPEIFKFEKTWADMVAERDGV
jgi:hypothetical protein